MNKKKDPFEGMEIIEVDPKIVAEVNAMMSELEVDPDFWCDCEEHTDNVQYHENGARPKICNKHHWQCLDCKKVRQVG